MPVKRKTTKKTKSLQSKDRKSNNVVKEDEKQQKNYFKDFKTYPEMKKYFDEQRKIHHNKKRPLTKEEAETFEEMNRQYETSPIVKEGREEQKRNKAIREEKDRIDKEEQKKAEKERHTVKGVLTANDAVDMPELKNYSNREIDEYAKNMFGKITLVGKKNNELSNKFMDFSTHEAFKQQINIKYINDYADVRPDLLNDNLKRNMEYLRHVEKEIGTKYVSKMCANKVLKDLNEIESYGIKISIGTVKNGYKDISFARKDKREDFEITISNSKELKSLKNSVVKGLQNCDKHFDKTNAFKNMLIAKDLSLSNENTAKIFLGSVNDKKDNDVIEQRAYQMLKNVMETKEKSKDGKFHNRDKVRELGDLFKAVKMVGDERVVTEFGQKVLEQIDTIRIHNKALGFRGRRLDYINQQNMIDKIRCDINMLPFEKGSKMQAEKGIKIEPATQNPDDIEEEIDMNQELLQNDEPINTMISNPNIVDDNNLIDLSKDEAKKPLSIPTKDIENYQEDAKTEQLRQSKQSVKNTRKI